MVLDTSLLNTQRYKVWIKSKVEHSQEKRLRSLLHLSVVAIEKGAFVVASTMATNLLLYGGCANIYGSHMNAKNSTNYNDVYFLFAFWT